MASTDAKLTIQPSEQFLAELQKVRAELNAAKEALSEARIRQIVQDELAKYDKEQVHKRRFGEQFERK
jgi:uncharacterized protein (DUF3084 family)